MLTDAVLRNLKPRIKPYKITDRGLWQGLDLACEGPRYKMAGRAGVFTLVAATPTLFMKTSRPKAKERITHGIPAAKPAGLVPSHGVRPVAGDGVDAHARRPVDAAP